MDKNISYDIFVFKTKNNLHSDNDWQAQCVIDSNYERGIFLKAYNSFVRELEKTDDYEATYRAGIKRLAKYFNFPNVNLNNLGYHSEDRIDVKPINVVMDCKQGIIDGMNPKFEADYENVDMAFQFFKPYISSGSCWLTPEILDDGISRCDTVMRNKSLAPEILPSEGGYGSDYFATAKAFRKSLKKLRTLMTKKYELYALIVGEEIEPSN